MWWRLTWRRKNTTASIPPKMADNDTLRYNLLARRMVTTDFDLVYEPAKREKQKRSDNAPVHLMFQEKHNLAPE